MIEQGIYFALGCIVTALAAIGFTPLLWRRALRLTRRRLALQVPLSMQEILAQRDQLRAEFAIERLRSEQAIEDVRKDKGRDMAELGRRTAQAVTFADQVNALRRLEQAQDKEIATLARENTELAAEAGAVRVALDDGHATIERLRRHLRAAEDACDLHLGEVEGQRATIAALEGRVAELEARRGSDEGVGGWIKAAVAQVTGHAPGEGAGEEAARRELAAAQARVDELAGELRGAREREQAATLRDSLRGHGDARPDQAEALRAENAALRGALEAVRRVEAGGAPGDGDAALRDSIHALGLAVAAMTRQAQSRDENVREVDAREAGAREALAPPVGAG